MKVVCAFGVAGGAVASGILYLAYTRHQFLLRREPYFRKALNVLEGNTRAVDMLGKPIKVKNINLLSKEVVLEEDKVNMAIPIRGSIACGLLHVKAHRESRQQWIVDKIALTIKDDPEHGDKLYVLHN